MIAVIISWIAISIVFLSFGDFLISLYNKLCRQSEQYGLTDTFLLGMCFTLIPLSFTSFWLPSGQYILFTFLILSIIYWTYRKNRLKIIIEDIKSAVKNYSLWHLIVFIIPVISLIAVILWQVGVFDALYYHHQNIRWNEEFAIIPGLGNIEYRFGFNSNYMLLAPVFGLRFIFGEAIYGLQMLILVYIICWILKEIILSGYEIKRVLLLVVITGYIFAFAYSFTATSTDAIPNIVAFYLIAKLLLYPNDIKNRLLLCIILPVSLITFKISIAPLCLISLYAFIILIKKRESRIVFFMLSAGTLIVALWLVRNVILTGYLVFPFYEIDIFNVEWKIPREIAIQEREFIYKCGKDIFYNMVWVLGHWGAEASTTANWLFYAAYMGAFILAPLVSIYNLIKKKYLDKMVYLIFLTLAAILLLWYTGGPDPRFAGGILFGLVYFVAFMIFSTREPKKYPVIGKAVLLIFILIMIYWPVGRTMRFSNKYNLNNSKNTDISIYSTLYKPLSYKNLLKSWGAFIDEFPLYRFDENITFYVSKSPDIPDGRFVCFDDPFPCIILPEDDSMKFQDIKDIEARGTTLQEGFRPKKSK